MKLLRFLTLKNKHPNPVFEAIAVYVMGYISYNYAELFDWSGACTIIVFALVFRHYGWYNLSLKGIIITK